MDNNVKRQWEERSKIFKDTLKGVMFTSFTDSNNKVIHDWELSILREYFPKTVKNKNILDIGCGYGRLSVPLAKEFNNAKFYGIDCSSEYISLYNKSLGKKGKAILSDIDKWPLKNKKFDLIFIITLLMYLSDLEIKNLIQNIKKNTHKDTIIVVIENNKSGVSYITGFGLLTFVKNFLGKENKHFIESRVFKKKEIEDYFKNNYVLHKKIRCSLLTLVLPFFLLFKKTFNLPKIGFSFFLPLPSVYIAYIFKVK